MKVVVTILLTLITLSGVCQTRTSRIDAIRAKGSKADSLKSVIASSAILKKDSVQNSLLDDESLQTNRISFAEQQMRNRVDSLNFRLKKDTTNFKIPTVVNLMADSLAIGKGNAAAKSNFVEEQKNGIRESGKTLQDKVKSPINDNLSAFSQGGANSISGVDIPNPNFNPSTGTNLSLPELNTGQLNLDRSLALPNDITSNTELESQSLLTGAKSTLDADLPESLDQPFGDVPGNLPHSKIPEVQQIKPESLTNEIENITAVRKASSQLSEAERVKQYFDPQVAKEEAVNKAKLEAVNHFSGHEQEIMAAIQLLSDAKSKVPGTDQIVDPFASESNSYKDIPTVERFVPSFTMQIQRSQSSWFDLNPAIGFRLSGRITAGAGWNYRFAYFANEKRLDQSARGYGVRTYLHFRINSLLSLKADIEGMNVEPRQFGRVNSELTQRTWAWGFFLGAKKDFVLGKRITGNVQMLYNLLRTNNLCPYVHKFNVRMGIDLPFYKKKNQIDSENKTSSK